jgi:hypothetical protein
MAVFFQVLIEDWVNRSNQGRPSTSFYSPGTLYALIPILELHLFFGGQRMRRGTASSIASCGLDITPLSVFHTVSQVDRLAEVHKRPNHEASSGTYIADLQSNSC